MYPLPESIQLLSHRTAHHDRVEIAGCDRHAAREALRVEHFEQRREAVGMAVVGRRGEKKAVLEAMRNIAHGSRELAGNGVARSSRGRGMVGFVQNEQGAGAEFPQDIAQPGT